MFLSIYAEVEESKNLESRGESRERGVIIRQFRIGLKRILIIVTESHVQLFVTPRTIQFMEFSRPEYWSGWPLPSPGDLPNPGIKSRSLPLKVDSLPAESQGKSKNTEVGSLSLLQQIFPTKESNQGLLHSRQILYQLNY